MKKTKCVGAPGLYIQVDRSGRKTWLFRYSLNYKAREMGLGSLLDVSLAEARQLSHDYRKLVRTRIDPIEARDRAKVDEAAERIEGMKRALGWQVTAESATGRYLTVLRRWLRWNFGDQLAPITGLRNFNQRYAAKHLLVDRHSDLAQKIAVTELRSIKLSELPEVVDRHAWRKIQRDHITDSYANERIYRSYGLRARQVPKSLLHAVKQHLSLTRTIKEKTSEDSRTNRR